MQNFSNFMSESCVLIKSAEQNQTLDSNETVAFTFDHTATKNKTGALIVKGVTGSNGRYAGCKKCLMRKMVKKNGDSSSFGFFREFEMFCGFSGETKLNEKVKVDKQPIRNQSNSVAG